MKLNKTGSPLTRKERNNINDNWDMIEGSYNNVVEEVTNEAFDKIIDGSKLDWSQMVDLISDLPVGATEGDTKGVQEDNRIYRYDGENWIPIAEINLNPISEVDQRLSSQLAQIVYEKIMIIGDGSNKTEEIQTAIDSIMPFGTVKLIGEFEINRVEFKSNLIFDISQARFKCEQHESEVYSRNLHGSNVENVTIIGGNFEGSGLDNDKTVSIYFGSSSHITFEGKQSFYNQSCCIELNKCDNVLGNIIFAKNLSGSYQDGRLRAALINGKGTRNVIFKDFISENSKKDVVYLGSSADGLICENWKIDTISSIVTHTVEGIEGYGFSQALHLRSIDGFSLNNLTVGGGYTGVEIEATTPTETSDIVKNVEISSINLRNIVGRYPVKVASVGEGIDVFNVRIGSINMENCVGLASASRANIYINRVENLYIGKVVSTKNLGSSIRLDNCINSDVGVIRTKSAMTDEVIVQAFSLIIRGEDSKGISVGSAYLNNDAKESTMHVVDIADSKDVSITKIMGRNIGSGIFVSGTTNGLDVEEVNVSNSDYVAMIRATCDNIEIISYKGENISKGEFRRDSGYLPSSDKRISASRKNSVVHTPYFDTPPIAGVWQRDDEWRTNNASPGIYKRYIYTNEGWKGYGKIEV